ncbi:DNA mismatch repair protein MutL [Persephonella hydrogeniphila]|uniref:DNA mismatch repair protein MutL n=1 Tax=Persephonella hydrogeniphila TaxID=198703 RepID=A0A285NCD4_9AQUI|nr:DNA mismatch repair endonuclease MutL [Persephonella hydrogeniphila]SNZ07110.1 DNA mismatch repair protein MutL [Persephonella hydrogeniphila]
MRIKKLPDSLINKIAAGEVVERPASVLKELIENALDAKADRIEIKVEKGGKKLIELKDNGTGIHPDDVLEAVNRYTTSKISSIEDIYSIESYGFRGEALSSISSVSLFSLISRQAEFPLGKELIIEGGNFKHLSDTGAPVGTTVRVKNLFFNTPARERFLKSEKTELKHIIDVFIRYAIYHNDKYFKLNIDGKDLYILNPSKREERIKNIFPKIDQTVQFLEENHTGKAYGYISPETRTGKGYIYINGRPVKNSILSRIIKSKIGESFYTLFLELPPYFVDFNVHPAKIDVRFRKEKPVHELVKKALETLEKPQISFSLHQQKRKYNREFKILGQVENTFLVVYYDGEIYFIDQHVASERINYELLMKKYRTGSMKSVRIPEQKIKISKGQKENLEKIKDLLIKAGFEFYTENENLYITGVPEHTKNKEIKSFIIKILNSDFPETEIESFIGELACELSIEAGDVLSDEEAKSLLKIWLETDNPNLCPHGRPIYYKIPVENIRKKVGRR